MKQLSVILGSALLLCAFSLPLAAGDAPAAAAKCPKKAAVVLETVKTESFLNITTIPCRRSPGPWR